jgi:hypothetical protein
VLGEIAAAAAKTDTFLGERYRRIVKRRGKLKALVAVAPPVNPPQGPERADHQPQPGAGGVGELLPARSVQGDIRRS